MNINQFGMLLSLVTLVLIGIAALLHGWRPWQ